MTLVDQVEQASRGRDQDVDAVAQSVDLFTLLDTTVDHGMTKVAVAPTGLDEPCVASDIPHRMSPADEGSGVRTHRSCRSPSGRSQEHHARSWLRESSGLGSAWGCRSPRLRLLERRAQ